MGGARLAFKGVVLGAWPPAWVGCLCGAYLAAGIRTGGMADKEHVEQLEKDKVELQNKLDHSQRETVS